MSALPHPDEAIISWEEFLRFQQAYAGPDRFCWVEGRVVTAMTGGTERHDLTINTLFRRLDAVYGGKPCVTFMHNRQVKTVRRSYYPDLLVRCGPATHPLYEDDARFVIEVLSPSNTPGERTEMLYDYQTVPSIEVIVFVDTRQRAVTIHRKVDGSWTERGTRNGAFTLGDVDIFMEDVWRNVDEASSFD